MEMMLLVYLKWSLIDIIGTFNGGTANFAADETIRRKSDCYSYNHFLKLPMGFIADTCNNLGSPIAVKELNLEQF
jgi:hypothetical protein